MKNRDEKIRSLGQRLLLICPPFQNLKLSSLCTPQLATYMKAHDVSCSEAYLNIDFYRILGKDRYETVIAAEGVQRNWRTGELLFAEGLHGAISNAAMETALTELIGPEEERQKLRARLETRVNARIDYEQPNIVGITTSFGQLMAALWMTRIIKKHAPKIRVVLGGIACSAPMGQQIAAAYPEVDHVVSGYGEAPLLKLAKGDAANRLLTCDEPVPLEELPLPEYRPFLRELASVDSSLIPFLLFRSSIGCWWGNKHHCTFCGLNCEGMGFHAKPVDRVIDDIRTLWERHGCPLVAVDSIMAREHLKKMVPKLALFPDRPAVFYEMKANMNEEDVIALGKAHVIGQPGIESLNTRLLKLMRKGVSTIRILALLKWCREQGVEVFWNQLCRIPGETEADYDTQIALMEKIPHFNPPLRVNPVVIDRYSPYFDNYAEYGWKCITPIPHTVAAHSHLNEESLQNISMNFEGSGGVSEEGYITRFEAAVKSWKERHQRGDGLYWNRLEGMTKLLDGEHEQIILGDAAARVIEATHRIASVERVMAETGCDQAPIDEMVENGFLYVEKGNVVNLTVRCSPPR